jgi:sugar/nucleoside kinase (ribokinase family)
MKILVIGHSVLDHIRTADSFRFNPGGIYYTALGLSTLKKPGDSYMLCTSVESGAINHFEPAFQAFSLEYSMPVERIPRVHLTVFADAERCERFENLNTKLQVPFEALSNFDALFINMISGFDIDLADLVEIRKRFQGLIYFDVHSLARGVGDGMVREFRRIADFKEWAKNLDIIQANENEIGTLSDLQGEAAIAGELLGLGVKALVVTKGERGASLYYSEGGEVKSLFEPALKTEVKNKVGCGDIFGAYFFKTFLESNDLARSLKAASLAGSLVTQFDSAEQYKKLADEVIKRLN